MFLLEKRLQEKPQTRPLLSFALANGTANIYVRAGDIDPSIWEAAYGETHKDLEYCRLIEETMTNDFTYRYLVLLDEEENPVALQPLILVDQDLAAAARAVIARVIARVRKIWPRFLRSSMLMAGFLVGDTHVGVVPPADPRKVAALLAQALRQFARQQKVSLLTIKDTLATSREDLQPLLESGFIRMEGFPPLLLPLDFPSFDEFMSKRLSRITRKGIRRKLRKSEQAAPDLQFEVLEDCSAVIDEIYPLYQNVVARSPVDFEIFTREYFLEAGRRMPGRFRYFLWRKEGRIVAFSFCVIWRDTIHDNDIGFDYDYAHDLHLYYVSFRDLVQWAVKNGLKYYRSAPFNYEPKLHLRLEPLPTDIYFRHLSPLLNPMIRRIAPLFAPTKLEPSLRNYLERAKS